MSRCLDPISIHTRTFYSTVASLSQLPILPQSWAETFNKISTKAVGMAHMLGHPVTELSERIGYLSKTAAYLASPTTSILQSMDEVEAEFATIIFDNLKVDIPSDIEWKGRKTQSPIGDCDSDK